MERRSHSDKPVEKSGGLETEKSHSPSSQTQESKVSSATKTAVEKKTIEINAKKEKPKVQRKTRSKAAKSGSTEKRSVKKSAGVDSSAGMKKGASFRLEVKKGVAVVTFDRPGASVNTLHSKLFPEVEAILNSIEADDSVKAVVIISGKKGCFVAGADIDELSAAPDEQAIRNLSRMGQNLFNRIEKFKHPVVAAISGSCLGGGLELALACRYRIAQFDKKTTLGLPEVMLGLLPGAGGTQRLPRLIGIEKALGMMLQGTQVNAQRALGMGLVDYVTHSENLEDIAVAYARKLPRVRKTLPKKKGSKFAKLLEPFPLGRRLIFKQARKSVLEKTHGHYPAPFAIIDCVEYGMSHGLEKGLSREAREFAKLSQTSKSKALISLYYGQTQLRKNRFGRTNDPVQNVAILGAGLMGAGIGLVSIQKGFSVRLKDISWESLAAGKRYVWKALEGRVKRRSVSSFDAKKVLARLHTQVDYQHFKDSDLVVEAVFEDLSLKHRVLGEVEEASSDKTIFASNTSALPITDIARKSSRPENVIGMHYFSPVHKMPLLEIVRTKQSSEEVVRRSVDFGLRQGKTVIVVNDGPGFYTTRILTALTDEAAVVALEGASFDAIDRAMLAYGFPVGPITLIDEVGIDVAAHIAHDLGKAFGSRLCSNDPKVLEEFVAKKALGRKAGKGFFIYDSGSKKKKGSRPVNHDAIQILNKYKRQGANLPSQTEIQERLAFRMVNEAAICMMEGILESPVDGDIGAVFGLGFPPFRGGPFHFLDSYGLEAYISKMDHYKETLGDRFEVAQLLHDMKKENKFFYSN